MTLESARAEFQRLDAARVETLLAGRTWPSPLWRKWHRARKQVAELNRRRVEIMRPEALN